jgi:hypothetical protein
LRISTVAIAVLAALLAGGCGTDGALDGPSPLASPPPIVPAEAWELTTTLTRVEGPACLIDGPVVGSTFDQTMQIRRDGTAITLLYGDPAEPTEAVGSIDGSAFSAASVTQSGTTLCDGVAVGQVFQSHLTGRFSAEGHSLTAKETWSFQFDTGEVGELSFEWTGTRRFF